MSNLPHWFIIGNSGTDKADRGEILMGDPDALTRYDDAV
jgi:hypothetical protein